MQEYKYKFHMRGGAEPHVSPITINPPATV